MTKVSEAPATLRPLPSPLVYSLRKAGVPFAEGKLLATATTFGVGGPADGWAQPGTVAQVQAVLRACREVSFPVAVVGNGANLLVLTGQPCVRPPSSVYPTERDRVIPGIAEVVGAEARLLEGGPHRSVEDQEPLGELGVQQGDALTAHGSPLRHARRPGAQAALSGRKLMKKRVICLSERVPPADRHPIRI